MFMKKRYLRYFPAAFAAAITLALFSPALRNDFINWDDNLYVVNNPNIRSFDLAFLWWALTDTSSVVYWQPLTWISYALDYLSWGLDPFGYHLTNILLHGMNTFIVVLLVLKLLETDGMPRRALLAAGGAEGGCSRPRLHERTLWIAAGLTGLFFGLHPLRVESVAWVAERKDLLYFLFYLLGIMAYTSYGMRRAQETGRHDGGNFLLNRHYLLTLGWYVLALASKPMAVTFPVILLLLDWYPFDRVGSWKALKIALGEKVPFLALSAAVSVITIIAQRDVEAMVSLDVLPLSDRIATAFRGLMMYLVKTVLPFDLVPLYPYPKDISLFSFEYLSAIALVCAITAVCVALLKREKVFMAAWAFFVITLFPVLGFFQAGAHSMADRFTYLPGLGPALLVGLASSWGWERTRSLRRSGRGVRSIMVAAAIILLVSLSFLTLKQIGVWKNSIDFWTYLIEKEPGRVPVAHINRGVAFKEERRYDRAIEDFNAVLAGGYSPRDSNLAYNYRGAALVEMGLLEQGMEDFTAAIALEPSKHLAYCNRGLVLGKMGRYPQAIEDFTRSIELNPDDENTYIGRGLALAETGQLDRAREDLDKAIALNRYHADAYLNRGLVFERKGMLERALADYSRVIELDPADYLAYANRGVVLDKRGEFDRAIEDYTRAIGLNSDYVRAYLERGGLLSRTGSKDLAAADFQKACELGSKAGCDALHGTGSLLHAR
jgi:tetratricopeptide (TPR) repeat protein